MNAHCGAEALFERLVFHMSISVANPLSLIPARVEARGDIPVITSKIRTGV